MAGDVVLGYDGQHGSEVALRTATQIAAAFKRPLVIVFGYSPTLMGGDVGDLRRAVRELGEQFTEKAVADVKALDPSVEVEVQLVDLRPAEAVLEVARVRDALAIVIGATGEGPMKGALLGNVTYQVVHRSTRPVVVVPEPDED
jgi:nucleotide-binding universal stress UspA family protein